MKVGFSVLACAVCAVLRLSAATIDPSSVTLTQTAPNDVTIGYTLGGNSAIVTFDVETNVTGDVWASIGGEHCRTVEGAVNTVVQPGARTFRWRARKDWPDQKLATGKVRAVVKAWPLSSPPDWLVVDTETGSIAYYATREQFPGGFGSDLYKTRQFVMHRIKAAGVLWEMGGWAMPYSKSPKHDVILSDDFYVGIYEMTERQYANIFTKAGCSTMTSPGGKTFSNADLSKFSFADDGKRPAGSFSYDELRDLDATVSWPGNGHDVADVSFFGAMRNFTGNHLQFDLLTEAQWEYACRAGAPSDWKFCYGSDESLLSEYGWVCEASGTLCHEVGCKKPNGWWLYDMYGNGIEFCLDWYYDNGSSARAIDPVGPTTSVSSGDSKNARCARGWNNTGVISYSYSSARYRNPPATASRDFSIRVACPVRYKE